MLRAPSLRRVVLALVVAVAFGVALSLVKGNASGVRDTLGNVSAPWLLLPFLSAVGAARGRPAAGAAVGLLATFTALAAFYVANAFVLDLGPHSLTVDLRLTIEAGRRYFALAVLSGPTFGALGGLWAQRRSAVAAVMVTSLLVFEPLAWLAFERSSGARFDSSHTVWVGESLVGLVACIAVGLRLRSRLATFPTGR